MENNELNYVPNRMHWDDWQDFLKQRKKQMKTKVLITSLIHLATSLRYIVNTITPEQKALIKKFIQDFKQLKNNG